MSSCHDHAGSIIPLATAAAVRPRHCESGRQRR